ncbi:MAG: hypothetical protein R3F20_02365 [Planctomycetota bacterium]
MAKSTQVVGIVNAAIEDANRQILSQALSGLPKSATIGELVDGLHETDLIEEFRGLTLEAFTAILSGRGARGGKRGRPARAAKAAPAPKGRGKKTAGAKRNTRTQEGRDALDAAIIEALQGLGEPSAAEAIRPVTGGTAAQVRDSLKRLAESKAVKVTGQRRGTRYALK